MLSSLLVAIFILGVRYICFVICAQLWFVIPILIMYMRDKFPLLPSKIAGYARFVTYSRVRNSLIVMYVYWIVLYSGENWVIVSWNQSSIQLECIMKKVTGLK